MASTGDQSSQLVRFAGKARERVGVEDDRSAIRGSCERGRHEPAQIRPCAGAWTERHGAPSLVGEQCLERRWAGEGRDHDGGAMSGVDGDGLRRACQQDDSRACPKRRPRREPGRAGLVRWTREDHRRPARVFVGLVTEAGKGVAPQGRSVHEGVGVDPGENARRNADVGEADRPAQCSPRLERVAGLQAEEGNGGGRLDRDAAHLARRSVETRRRVDRKDPAARACVRIDPLHEDASLAVDVARKPRAEDRIDDAGGAIESDRAGRRDCAVEARRRCGGVPGERAARPEQAEVDREAAPGQ